MLKQIVAIVAISLSLPALADWITITSVKPVELGYNNMGLAVVSAEVGTTMSSHGTWEALDDVIGSGVIKGTISSYRDGVKIDIRNAQGQHSTVVQEGQIHQFKVGDAELHEADHNSRVRLRVLPNA